jgi:hypothetical protein
MFNTKDLLLAPNVIRLPNSAVQGMWCHVITDGFRAETLVGGQVGEVGAVAFSRVDDLVAQIPECCEHFSAHRGLQSR